MNIIKTGRCTITVLIHFIKNIESISNHIVFSNIVTCDNNR